LKSRKPREYEANDIYTLDLYTRKESKDKVIEAKGDGKLEDEELQHVWRRRRGVAKRMGRPKGERTRWTR
jgi:hypothetical protein